MKTAFEIKKFLTANRDLVIAKYNETAKQTHFNGINLKSFMLEVYGMFLLNNVKSEKVAAQKLPFYLDDAKFNNSKVSVKNNLDDKNRVKYAGTQYMSLV